MVHRNSIYCLGNVIECDDAFVGGKKPGKRGRGVAGKKPIIVVIERRENHAGFMVAEGVDEISKNNGSGFLHRHLKPSQEILSRFITLILAGK